ncbi:hypothetical protein WME75_03300 [Sorangium sp. So ce1014]|uniref:hypothetical protein n=1 Tax=Sorangium sp. So ce1014 TaxID=3133326 RepID=UPI003F617EE4
MERSSAILFDTERVARPLSERGHVDTGAGPAGPVEPVAHSTERRARDLVAVKSRWGGAKGEAGHTARSISIALAAAAVLAVGIVAAAAAVRSRRERWRIWW